MTNKTIRRRLILCFICLAIFAHALSASGIEQNTERIHLVILHVNDTHGRLMPYDTGEAKSIGGIARMATRIKEIREANEGRTLVLHAGDVFSRGDSLTFHYGGKVNLLAMEAMGYDAFTPGNGDFYFGVENLTQQASLVGFPKLLANVFYKGSGERVFQPYVGEELAGMKIAILALGIIRRNHPSARPLELRDHVETAKEFLPTLRDKADLVIALSHTGIHQDTRLAIQAPEIDIIVGGHTHSQLDTPLRIPRGDKGEIIIVQAGEYCKFLGRLDVYLQADESGEYHLASAEGKLLPIDRSIEEDEEITELLARYSEPLSEVICTSKAAIPNPGKGESPLGKMVAEAIRVNTGADVTLLDRGAVKREIKPGDITVASIHRIHPWRNKVIEFALTGDQLRQILAGQDIFTSGLSYSKVDGKIEDLRVDQLPAEPGKTYKVAAGEFLLSVVPSLQKIPFRETGERVDTVLSRHLRQLGIIGKTEAQ